MDKVILLVIALGLVFQTMSFVEAFRETRAKKTVTLPNGELMGMEVELPNPKLPPVVVYRGLRYATVRRGEFRFMASTSTTDTWDSIRLAKSFAPVCPQKSLDVGLLETQMPKVKIEHLKRVAEFTKKQTEDCLNLNLYVPLPAPRTTETAPYPVVVFVHGDSYEFGTGNAYDGSVLASFGQVIVVTLNYRLGALGFLSTGDGNAAGNYALLDIVAALHWLNAHIENFGGDKARVTLLGQGYGAALVNILSSSPIYSQSSNGNAGLYQRIILQSGSALASWAICPKPIKWARKLSEKLNCSNDKNSRDHNNMVRCLKGKTSDQIAQADVRDNNKFYCGFGPVVDGEYGPKVLPDDVEVRLKKPHAPFNQIEVLMGMTRDAGFHLMRQSQIDGITADQREHIIQSYVRALYKQQQQSIVYILDYSYKDHEREKEELIMSANMMEMLGDGQYNVPMLELANSHVKNNNTFFYVFGYPSRGPDYPDGGASVEGDDLMYLMGAPLVDGVSPFRTGFGNGERMIGEAVMRYFTNFMKSGNPNKPRPLTSVVLRDKGSTNRYAGLKWGEYNLTTRSYMHLGMRPSMKRYYRGDKYRLWVDLIPKVHQDNTTSKRHLGSSMFITPPPPTPPPSPPPMPGVSSTHRKSTTKTTQDPIFQPPVKSGETKSGEDEDEAMVETTRDPPISMSLSITIAVGCSLLFLNIIVFAAVYYQKDKLKFEKQLREKEKERDRLEIERVARDSIANSKTEQIETDSLLDEDEDRAPPTPQRNNSLPHSPLLNHTGRNTASPPAFATLLNTRAPESPEKLLRRTSGQGRYTPSPNLRRDLDNNRRSDSTDSGAMMHNGSDDAPVTMV